MTTGDHHETLATNQQNSIRIGLYGVLEIRGTRRGIAYPVIAVIEAKRMNVYSG